MGNGDNWPGIECRDWAGQAGEVHWSMTYWPLLVCRDWDDRVVVRAG